MTKFGKRLGYQLYGCQKIEEGKNSLPAKYLVIYVKTKLGRIFIT